MHFGGRLALFSAASTALSPAAIQAFANARPDFSLITFNALGVGWPWQEHAWRGLSAPQDAWTLPRAKSPPSAPVAQAIPASKDLLEQRPGLWTLASWKLIPAPRIEAGGERLSQQEFDDSAWYTAVVPGHGADDTDRARHLSGPGLWTEQSCHSGHR